MFEVITKETVLDPAIWGPYVVVKPDKGGRGAYVWSHKTNRVRHKEPQELRADHPGRYGQMREMNATARSTSSTARRSAGSTGFESRISSPPPVM